MICTVTACPGPKHDHPGGKDMGAILLVHGTRNPAN